MDPRTLKSCFVGFPHDYVEGEVLSLPVRLSIRKPIAKATLFSTGFGMYELLVNGKKIDTQFFKPGYTYYPRRLLYQTIDLALHLKEENTLDFLLGQGWYSGRYFCENTTQNYGKDVSLAFVLEVEYRDGEKEIITSKEGMDVYSSIYEYAGEYDGEVVDENKEPVLLGKTISIPCPEVSLEKTLTEVRLHETFSPKNLAHRGETTIVDFGQNMAGIISLDTSKLKKGETITIRHGEILTSEGDLYTANLRKAKATIRFTKGEKDREYLPYFTYMGFRYVEISGVPYQDGLIRAHALYTDMKRTGYFVCGHPGIEKLYENIVWGQKSNYVEVPTDCPQRDERLGYTGDGHVFALTGSYNFDTQAFWENFFRDLVLGQNDNPDGNVPPYLPQVGPKPVGFITMQGWGNAVSIIPHMIYWQYGDFAFLSKHYEAIRKYVDLEISKAGNKNLWCGVSLGDWLSLKKGIAWQAMNNHPVSNAFFVNDLRILKDLAKALGKEEEASYYEAQYQKTKGAYIRKFISRSGKLKKDYQGSYVLALKHVLTKEDPIRPLVEKRFVENVKKHGLETGFFGTEHLLPLLVEAGETKLAYDVLLSHNCPGWLYQVDRGATTTWERWDAIQENGKVNESNNNGGNMVSFNHYSFGSVGEFFYRYILGIQPLKPGYAKVLLRPYTDSRLGYAGGKYESVHGVISSRWEYETEAIHFVFDVPTKARIVLPNGAVHEVEKGHYEYRVPKNEEPK